MAERTKSHQPAAQLQRSDEGRVGKQNSAMLGQNPILKDYASHVLKRTKNSSLYRVGYELAAWLTPISVAFGFSLLYVFFGIYPTRMGLFLAGCAVIILFVRFRTLAKRYAIDTERAVLNDQRPPILYLRSFKQDATSNHKLKYTQATELGLTNALNSFGPVIAVGQPGEDLPPLGASRLYFAHHEWKERVKELMSISQLVVIHPENTSGVEWEMAAAKQIVAPERLVFVLASWHSLQKYGRQIEHEIFASQLKSIFNISLPEKFVSASFLFFANDWSPRYSSPSWPTRWLSGPQTAASFYDAVKPIFSNLASSCAKPVVGTESKPSSESLYTQSQTKT